jgi:hypothetical protein
MEAEAAASSAAKVNKTIALAEEAAEWDVVPMPTKAAETRAELVREAGLAAGALAAAASVATRRVEQAAATDAWAKAAIRPTQPAVQAEGKGALIAGRCVGPETGRIKVRRPATLVLGVAADREAASAWEADRAVDPAE